MKNRRDRYIENFVTFAIVLVLLQTCLEDLAVLASAPWNLRKGLIWVGFGFDLFFTLEFLIRSWSAFTRNRLGHYLWRENGWVDFIASVPLLVLTSGPAVISLATGYVFAGGSALFGVLKILKIVRTARVLRLLRLLKIFRRIRFTDSRMAQRHSVRIITTAASALVFAVTLIGTVFAWDEAMDGEKAWLTEQKAAVDSLAAPVPREDVAAWGASRPSVLLVEEAGKILYSREDADELRRYFGPGDSVMHPVGSYSLWFDLRPTSVTQARGNLTLFFAALVVVFVMVLSYTPHFAMTVSDPVNVMHRGIRERSYNLVVRVPELFREDDVFRLAEAYNEEFLPLKERSVHEEEGSTLDISLDDIGDLLDKT